LYLEITTKLRDALAKHIRAKYGVELPIVLERPPKIELARRRRRCVLSWPSG